MRTCDTRPYGSSIVSPPAGGDAHIAPLAFPLRGSAQCTHWADEVEKGAENSAPFSLSKKQPKPPLPKGSWTGYNLKCNRK